MYYINGSYNNEKETIDETETFKDAKYLLNEYRLAYQGTGFNVWISSRACNNWKDRQ
jgi:hypothetical protein